jgi:hypothetical protein
VSAGRTSALANPSLLVCDTDVLIQIFISAQIGILQALSTRYGLRTVIVPEVETELRWTKRFADRFETRLDKALRNGILRVLDQNLLAEILARQSLPPPAVNSVFQAIQTTGRQYALRVDRGEAYTFSAAVALGMPAASNDNNALTVLEKAGLPVPSPALRFFDIVAFAVQIQFLSEADADKARQVLLQAGEVLPRDFQHAGFTAGLAHFTPRLLDGAKAPIGALARAPASGRARLLLVHPLC